MSLFKYRNILTRKLSYFRWILAFFFSISLLYTGIAQGNLKAGYLGTYYSYDLLEKTLDVFNAGNDYTEELSRLKTGHGLELGYRYKTENVGFDVSYSLAFAGSKITQSGVESTEVNLRYRHHTLHGGVESYFGNMGLGAAAQYNRLRISGLMGTDNHELIEEPEYWSIKAYLLFNFGGDGNSSVSIQPYVDIPLGTDHNIDGVADFLEIESQGVDKLPLSFGLRFIIYNGAQ